MNATADWTGTSAKRHEQGGCVNYGKYPPKRPGKYIPAGTVVSVCRVDDATRKWKKHTLRRDVYFNAWEGGRSGAVVIRESGWFILSRWEKVFPKTRPAGRRAT